MVGKPIQIGLTGGIGSGKTTVARILEHVGVSVYDADSRAKFLMTTDGILMRAIKKEFGNLAYRTDESLNRAYLASAVFDSPERREALNKLTHPAVARDYNDWVKAHETDAYLLKDAALLIEAGSYKTLDKIILVVAPEDLRIKRVLKRDPQRTEAEVRKIMEAQMSDQDKTRYAHYLLYNDETTPLIPQVLDLHSRLLALASTNQ